MSSPALGSMSSPALRNATAEDLLRLEGIENAADQLFASVLSIKAWPPAPPGAKRVRQPGFILVASREPGSEAIAFIHVLQIDGDGHLEQLSVHPSATRRGYGRALVQAAALASIDRGFHRLTLRTFADVPWNAPFYASCGFQPSEPNTDALRDLVREDDAIGLSQQGLRLQMELDLKGYGGPQLGERR